MSATEIWLAPGGDFIQTDNGDLLLAVDDADSAPATIQRICRLLTTNARIVDPAGNPISTPGDLFHPDYGASEPALVDQPVTQAFIADLQARILKGLSMDPTIVQNPAPQVVVTLVNTSTVSVQITAKTVQGQTVQFSLPS